MKRSAGFTLIELMITVVIVTILVAIALPSYQAHMIRAIRSAGQQFLLDIAQRQEQYFLDARWYAAGIAATSTAGICISTGNWRPKNSARSRPPSSVHGAPKKSSRWSAASKN